MTDLERRCIVTGAVGDAADLIRFVVSPDGAVVPDVDERLPGRGLWVTADRGLLERAVSKQQFSRAAKQAARAGADLPVRTEELLARRCTELLGLARRAGELAIGFDAVAGVLDAGRASVLVTAAEAGPVGREKLGRKAASLPDVDWLSVGELSLALGKENVVHAAIAPGRLAHRFLREARRLRGFRGTAAGDAAADGSSP